MGKKIFSSDNRVNRFLSHLFDIIVLNLLWMVFCIPFITIGASTIALYTMTLKIVRNEEGALVKGFLKAFRGNFRQSLPVTLIFQFAYSLGILCLIRSGWGGETFGALKFGASIAALIFITAIWVWIIPLMARYENTLAVHFNNAWRLAVGRLSYTLTFITTTLLPFVWAAFMPGSFIYLLPFWVLLGGAGVAAFNSIYLRKVFDELEKSS